MYSMDGPGMKLYGSRLVFTIIHKKNDIDFSCIYCTVVAGYRYMCFCVNV